MEKIKQAMISLQRMADKRFLRDYNRRLTTSIRTQEYFWSYHLGKPRLIEKWTALQKNRQRGCHPKKREKRQSVTDKNKTGEDRFQRLRKVVWFGLKLKTQLARHLKAGQAFKGIYHC